MHVKFGLPALVLLLFSSTFSAAQYGCADVLGEDEIKLTFDCYSHMQPPPLPGKAIFFRHWQVESQSKNDGGLGPLYNANSCASCHINNGSGRPPAKESDDPSFVMRLSISPQNEKERMALALEKYATIAEPRYGRQLQNKGTGGDGEGTVRIEYRDKPYRLDDGKVVILHRPVYSADKLKYGALHKNAQISLRIAQSLYRVGSLDAISSVDILALEDPRDEDGDGISGRANKVRDIASGKIVPGRFGWKATQPNLRQQVAAAFAQDIGISSSLFPQTAQECTDNAVACTITGSSDKQGRRAYDISDTELRQIAEFVSRRSLFIKEYVSLNLATKRIGEKLFASIGCASCHRESYEITIGDNEGELKTGKIYPYSDFLLHDMGAALADHRPVAQASGWEWRTQPLWGIGKAEAINGNKFFLHDGRARTITEAILWHGGEARRSREKFAALNKQQRSALVEFVEGL